MNNSEFNKSIASVSNPLPGSTPESVTYKLTVKQRYNGMSILDFFCNAVPRSDRSVWINKINTENLTVNGKSITEDYVVKAGDITQHSSDPKVEPPVNTSINLLFEDEEILVIDKPSPLPMHASGRFVRNTLIGILDSAFPDIDYKLLHRIDANTTGVVIIAKNKESANNIRLQFEEKLVSKEYLALVEGIIKEDSLKSFESIGNEVLVGGARKVDDSGKKAETHIAVLERRFEQNQTLISVEPKTGRTNQIRLHLANIGYPIVGDIGHKDKEYFNNNPFTYPNDTLFLHAHKLTLTHPSSAKKISFEAPIPNKFGC
jgi:23S rRNA pseudouridine1911/1915/1917 synthase